MPTTLPDRLPILARRADCGACLADDAEPEITSAVDLCDARGRLNPAAVGWSRLPLVRANLSGHWPRKKRWNFWNWISPRFVFSVTLADIDYAAFCQFWFADFATGRTAAGTAPAWPGSLGLPEHVERTVRFRGGSIDYENATDGGDLAVRFAGAAGGGERVAAEFTVQRPPGQESLNVVVPWSQERFQLNSKHSALPCAGSITVGDLSYAMEPGECHAVQDFGRGLWPYRSFWNWGVATGVQDGVRIGVNLGAKWTTGTGVSENGLLIDGRAHKIAEELRWEYDPLDWMRPWRVRAERSGAVDLTLEPILPHHVNLSLGVLGTRGVCCFGRWSGTIRFAGQTLAVRSLIGWAEEFSHRW